jgi:hypothetical protein
MAETRKVKVPQWIEGQGPSGPFVLKVEAEAVVPVDDSSEPCFEPRTMRWLEDLQRLADSGKVEELSKHGTVFVRRSA